MQLKKFKKKGKRVYLLGIILLCLILNIYLSNFYQNQVQQDNKTNFNEQNFDKEAMPQGLTSENEYYGIGSPWNITHWANRTDYNLLASFTNDSYDMVQIPLGIDWTGEKLNANIDNLYDNRNWNNGTFEFGSDDGTYNPGENDTNDIVNNYQNWTFYDNDIGSYTNDMSGNYIDDTFAGSDGHNCLELRMDGDYVNIGGSWWYGYDEGDKCWWESYFIVPRGTVVDSILKFDFNPNNLANFNSWDFSVGLNDKQIYSSGTYSLQKLGEGNWHSFNIPQNVWTNSSNIYSSPINGTTLKIKIAIEYVADTARYSEGFYHISHQQLFIDNLELWVKAESKPTQIQLKMNNTDVNDIDWGKGSVELTGSWKSSEIFANFSSNDVWGLSSYYIDLKTSLNLFAFKDTPETNYETNFVSEGTKFSVESGNLVNWEAYSYFAVPTGYIETIMRLEFPTDFSIIWVSEPQLPSTNRLSLCDTSTPGVLLIPVDTISTTPDGFWKFEATSPNHLTSLDIFKNTSIIPNPVDWISENVFYCGDYINFTAAVTLSPLFSGYITQTQALLQIKFPNGTLWEQKSQYKFCDASGNIYFDYFQIPKDPPNYEVGEYTAIITWNNTYSLHGLNETGTITKTFTVKHFSTLIPDQSYYSNILEGDTINLIVSFNDKENGDAIRGALVYTDNFLGERKYFNEISPGFYVLLDFNTSGGIAGDNLLTIYANSSLYQNNSAQITINLVLRTSFTAQEFPYLQVEWKENFTVHLNYTEVTTGNGIITTPSSNWLGEYSVNMVSPGIYNMEFNSSLYEVNKIHSLLIEVNEPNYETQNLLIKVEIIERETYIDNIFLNGIEKTTDKSITLTSGELLNITFSYYDEVSSNFLSGATARVVGGGLSEILNESLIYHHYEIILNTSILEIGATFLTISAQLQNYSSVATVLTIYIGVRGSSLLVLLNGATYPDNYINVEVWQTINITVKYTDLITGKYLSNATIELLGHGNFTENPFLKQYNYTIEASILGQGIDILSIIASKSHYQSQAAQITVEITERKSILNLYLNGDNKTSDPFLVLPIGSQLNITVKYLDLFGIFIDNADVQLLGEGLSEPFNQNFSLKHYSMLLNTRKLEIGVRLLTVVAQRNYYQIQTINLRLDIKRIRANISTLSGDTTINLDPGESAEIKIILNDLDFGGLILNASVTYRWQYGQGILADDNNDGIYEAVISDIPEGSFTFTITAFAGDDYDFERYELTITVIPPPDQGLLFLILAIIGGIVSVGLLSYLYLYQKVLKYPKPVRKVRKYRKTLRKGKEPRINIISRKTAFIKSFQEETNKTSKILKGSPLDGKVIQEKMFGKVSKST